MGLAPYCSSYTSTSTPISSFDKCLTSEKPFLPEEVGSLAQRIAKNVASRNSLDHGAYCLGKMLGDRCRQLKPNCERSQFLEALTDVKLFSEEYLCLVNQCNDELFPNGLHRLSKKGQMEFNEILKVRLGIEISPKELVNTTPWSYFGRYQAIDLVTIHGSRNLWEEMLTLYPFVNRLPDMIHEIDVKKFIRFYPLGYGNTNLAIGSELLLELVQHRKYTLIKKFLDVFGIQFMQGSFIRKPFGFNSMIGTYSSPAKVAVILRDYRSLVIFIEQGYRPEKGESPLELAAKDANWEELKNLLQNSRLVTSKWLNQALQIARDEKNSFVRKALYYMGKASSDEDFDHTISLLEGRKASA